MKRQTVTSSAIRSIGYDRKTRTLEIEFPSGHVYQYFEVPPGAHGKLMRADSLGHYFNVEIKDLYACVQVR